MLEHIPDKNELNRMSSKALKAFCQEIRSFLVEKVSKKGGHLSSNLGAVELTVALYSVFDFPKDKIIFDVGHQSYTHKLLSGRKEGFDHLRETDGMSGFPKRHESPFDAFDTGHASNSISAAIGYVKARDILREDHTVIAVIGDGSMTGGEAYEALNNAARLKSNLIIILNDNEMSISRNVGGMTNYLASLRSGEKYNRAKDEVKETLSTIPGIGEKLINKISNAMDSLKEIFVSEGMLFENMGLTYLGPIDGHNIRKMKQIFRQAKSLDRAVLIHVVTQKGKGYPPAEKHPDAFHGVECFDIKTGKTLTEKTQTWSSVFGDWIVKKAAGDSRITAITAAMGDNVGLHRFSRMFHGRFFDVGIAEQHAVTFAAGMAAGGLRPVCAIFSSFLQRSYDQIVHDVCMQDLPVTFAIDRAGIVGKDGETHQGVFDLSYLLPIPNICIMAPKDEEEFRHMLDFSIACPHPCAVRYPRGEIIRYDRELPEYRDLPEDESLSYGKAEILYHGKDIAVLAVGDMVKNALEARRILEEEGISVTVVNMRFLKPFDTELLDRLKEDHSHILVLENGVETGGFGDTVSSYYADKDNAPKVYKAGIPDRFIPQGDPEDLFRKLRLDAFSIAERIRELSI